MFKKYPPQHGPNLAPHEAQYGPGDTVRHGQGCDGNLVQVISNHGVPLDSPGKIFCHRCGIKAGKKLTDALKRRVNRETFYFPNRKNWELYAGSFPEKGQAGKTYLLRYWEFRHKEPGEEIHLNLKKKIEKARRALRNKPKRKVEPFGALAPLGLSVTHHLEGEDYVLVHPQVTIRLARNIFTLTDLEIAKKVLKNPINVGLSKEGLVSAVMVALGVHAVDVHETEF